MSFLHPWWLLAAGLAIAAMVWTWRIADARQRDSLQRFIGSRLRAQLTRSISITRRSIRRAMFAAAVVLLVVALAGPRLGFHWEQVKRRGNDIIFAVDTSRSMSTPDVKPNRLARAKLAIDDFVARLNGDAVGLIAFAGSAFLQCPITLDYGAFHESLAALDTHIIPRGGTNITSAIHEAEAALQRRPDSDKVMILVTDGEDLEGDALAAAKLAAQHDGLKIYTVGVGTPNGDLIPLPADQGGGYLRDGAGQLVKSHLDETSLKALAAATGGTYAALGAQNEGLDDIYQKALAPLAKRDLETRSQKIYNQRYQWPLGASLALLIGSLLMGVRRRTVSTPHRVATPVVGILSALVVFVLIPRAHASPTSAAQAYARGDFSAAQQQFAAAAAKDPRQPVLHYDAGTAAYRAGAYSQAAQDFLASVNGDESGNVKRLSEQQDAYYNLGNTLYRQGQAVEKTDRNAAIESWSRAVKSYDAALQLRTDDADSRYNRDLVNRKLEELKKQPPQNQPQPQDKPQSSNQAKNQQSPSAGDKSGAGSNEANQPKEPKGSKGSKDQQKQASQQPSKGQPSGQDKGDEPKQTGGPTPPAGQQEAPRPGSQQAANAQAGDDQRTPGGMSPQEARELLDSVKNEEKRSPAAPMARNGAADDTVNEPLKDW